MKKEIILLDLFSGIGGFAKGISNAGFKIKTHYFSEVDKHAIANYKYNFNEAKYIGSVSNVRGSELERPDIITFGSPCQDFSLAGKRKGLDGNRSSLIAEAIRLISECRPSVFIWENVKGAFSSNNGDDFWSIIQAFTNIGGYRLEWQLLNTSWFLPQNRERIYLVGHLAGGSEFGLFPFRENDQLFDNTGQSEKGQSQTQISTTITNGNLRADDTYISVPKTAGCLTGGGNSGGLYSDMTLIKQLNHKQNFGSSTKQQERVYDPSGIMACLSSSRTDDKSKIIVKSVSTPARKDKQQNGSRIKDDGEPSFTLTTQDQHGILIDEVAIRRLTEIECERLQGFPDDWTKFGVYEDKKGASVVKPIAKTQRYKMIGNAVSVPVVTAVTSRLNINN